MTGGGSLVATPRGWRSRDRMGAGYQAGARTVVVRWAQPAEPSRRFFVRQRLTLAGF